MANRDEAYSAGTNPAYLFRIVVHNEDGSITPYEEHYRNAVYARKAMAQFEEEDKADGCYVPGAYEIQRRTSADSDDWHLYQQRAKVKHNNYTASLRLSDKVYADLSAKAEEMGMSVNATIKMIIAQWLYSGK